MRRSFPASSCALAALLLLSAGAAGAAPVLELQPGLWAHDSEIWINGQSLKPGLAALRTKVRGQLTDEQKRELDRRQAAEKQSCLTPQQARIDLARYLEMALSNAGGPWRCEANASKLDSSAAEGRYACRTNAGGSTQGKFSATYGPKSYQLELNGRGNAVDGRTGEAISGVEVDQRMLSTGRWLGGDC